MQTNGIGDGIAASARGRVSTMTGAIMAKKDIKTRVVPRTDDVDGESKGRRKYTVTTDTIKKVEWVRELLCKQDPYGYTIRGLADEVKKRFGTSMNTNLLADLLQAARNGELDNLQIEKSTSRRGRPTTLSPNALARRAVERSVRKITEAVVNRPAHLVCAPVDGQMFIEGFPTVEAASRQIKNLIGRGVIPSDIAYYLRGEVQADLRVELVKPSLQ